MYCAKCGTQNIEEANYCRFCGNTLQPLSTTALPEVKQFDQERALKKLTMGIGFLIFSSMLPSAVKPVFIVLGILMLVKGIRLLHFSKLTACASPAPTAPTNFRQIRETSAQQIQTKVVKPTGELVPPPSVTEHTTKLFDRQ
jgi:hypothetical protein